MCCWIDHQNHRVVCDGVSSVVEVAKLPSSLLFEVIDEKFFFLKDHERVCHGRLRDEIVFDFFGWRNFDCLHLSTHCLVVILIGLLRLIVLLLGNSGFLFRFSFRFWFSFGLRFCLCSFLCFDLGFYDERLDAVIVDLFKLFLFFHHLKIVCKSFSIVY